MADNSTTKRPVLLPADLLARMEELKADREQDQGKSVEDLLREFCEDYVAVREMARDEKARLDEIDRSYQEQSGDWDDAAGWAQVAKHEGKEPQ